MECSHAVSALEDGGTFVDACAGPATFSIAMLKKLSSERLSSCRMLISDFSVGMVEAAKLAMNKIVPNRPYTEFAVTDVQQIDLRDDSVNVVACMFGYFVPDRQRAWRELARILKPRGGTAIVGTWKNTDLVTLGAHFLEFLGHKDAFDSHRMAHACADAEALQKELLAAGFSQVSVHERSYPFELPMDGEDLAGVKKHAVVKMKLSEEEVQLAWDKFIHQCDFPWKVDFEQNLFFVNYSANLAVATK